LCNAKTLLITFRSCGSGFFSQTYILAVSFSVFKYNLNRFYTLKHYHIA